MIAGRNTVYTAQASEAAEAGLATAFSPWNRDWNHQGNFPVGQDRIQAPVTVTLVNGTPAPTKVRYTLTVRRLQGGAYLISSEGQKLDRNNNVVASRRLAKFAKLVPPGSANVEAAVTTKSDVTVAGNANINGNDAVPPAWDPGSCGPLDNVAGVHTGGGVTLNGNPTVTGSPPMVQHDSLVTDATFQGPFYDFLDGRTNTITASNPPATLPTVSGGACNKSNLYNWGEPRRDGAGVAAVEECQNHFPVVYFGAGTLKLQGGVGQGILLVAGDLWLAGGFEYTGLIIVLGEIKTTGNGNKVTGAILSNNFYGEESSIGGTPTVQYSSCAVQAALTNTSSGYPLDLRPWAQINPR
jgi:hypothetical protein